MTETTLAVRHMFTMVVDGAEKPATRIKGGPAGDRMVFEVTGGTISGERISGHIVSPSGDWLYRYPDGSMHLDVRISIKTDDGADVLMQYEGKLGPNGARSAPTFLTSSDNYAWMNSIQAVGIGSFPEGQLTYEVYELL